MSDSTALVTGAGKGIGKQIAAQLAAAGVSVHVGSRDLEADSSPSMRSAAGPGCSFSTSPMPTASLTRRGNVSSGTSSLAWSTGPNPQ